MPPVTAVAATSHRLREPQPLPVAASLSPSATPPPTAATTTVADVASRHLSATVAGLHSRPPSRSGREARIWGGTAAVAAEHRAVAAQGPMPPLRAVPASGRVSSRESHRLAIATSAPPSTAPPSC
ncbi:Os04g0411525 [Oryza sativa Japonica Group]|uniref:Os04g0411525 protein n=1 Tax=Oryza sativa subsp. japonica TaxID=39947 RepID=A0A0P0WA14_ORYSJ|nr:Os04g0411525 [Oryza sativa Japonica Group]